MMNFLEEETVIEQNSEYAKALGASKNRLVASDVHSNNGHLSHSDNSQPVIGWDHGALLKHSSYQEQNSLLIFSGLPLLSLMLTINRLPEPHQYDTFRTAIKQDLFKLRQNLEQYQVAANVISKVCFMYTVVLDEAIIHSPWGNQICWENHTLLSELFGYCNGGELIFELIDDALANHQDNPQLIELIHLFLKLGYQGKYRNSMKSKINQLTVRCEQILAHYRQRKPLIGCLNIRDCQQRKVKHAHHFKSLFSAALVGCCVLATGLYYHQQQQTEQRLIAIKKQLSPNQPLQGPILASQTNHAKDKGSQTHDR